MEEAMVYIAEKKSTNQPTNSKKPGLNSPTLTFPLEVTS